MSARHEVIEAPAISRRRFVTAAAASLAVAGIGATVTFGGSSSAAEVRPPGAVREADLLARCNRCQRCVQACPYAIVQPLPLTFDGLAAVGTPFLAFKTGFCDFCMKCAEACPTGALRKTEAADADGATGAGDAKLGVAVVVSDACVAWDWTGCRVCADDCPVDGAITLDANMRPVVDSALCNGCGKCEFACPASSLRAYNNAVLDRGIYIVPLSSAAAQMTGALSSEQMRAARRMTVE